MAFVSVPKDLTKVKNKLVFNLTKRQLICFTLAGMIGVPTFFLGNTVSWESLQAFPKDLVIRRAI